MIVMRLMGGLGNQMFQYALGRRLALEHRVPLKLDLTWFEGQSLRCYILDRFRIVAEVADSQELSQFGRSRQSTITSGLFQFLRSYPLQSKHRYIQEKHLNYDPNIIRVPSRVYLDGYWQSERYFNQIENILRSDFTLLKSLSPQDQELADRIQSRPSVSLHVRRGDYATNPRLMLTHGICSTDYYHRALACIKSRIPQALFYIFSDDLDWVRQNLDFIKPSVYVQLDSPDRDVEELILMSLCQHHIIANSSYSWWGAWLGKNPDKIVVAPEKWFVSPQKNCSDLVPEKWIRL